MNICNYGCEKEGVFQMKNKKWCCSRAVSTCDGMKKKNSVSHVGCKSKNPFANIPHHRAMKGKTPWNKGKTKDTDIRILNSCSKISISLMGNDPCKNMSDDDKLKRRIKISETSRRNGKSGGKRHGSGRGKKGWYKEIFCDSSWELAYVVFCKEHDISIKRNIVSYPYVWNGKTRKYIPDFIVGEESEIVEIKGYETEQWKAKLKSVASIKVIGKNDIKKYIDYVEGKYGKNFISLYEKEDKSTEA